MQIEVTTDEQPLSHTVWTFYVSIGHGAAIDVRLDSVKYWTRPTLRHRKWTLAQRWPAHRDTAYGVIDLTERPAIPIDLETEIRARIAAAVTLDWSK